MAWSTVKMGIYRPAPGGKWQGGALMCFLPMPPKRPDLTPYGHGALPEWLSLRRDGPNTTQPLPYTIYGTTLGYGLQRHRSGK
jgi:hypothetical protein